MKGEDALPGGMGRLRRKYLYDIVGRAAVHVGLDEKGQRGDDLLLFAGDLLGPVERKNPIFNEDAVGIHVADRVVPIGLIDGNCLQCRSPFCRAQVCAMRSQTSPMPLAIADEVFSDELASLALPAA